MSNKYLNIQIESDFEYFSDKDISSKIQSDFLNFKAYFEQGNWLDSELDTIETELVETGKVFARNQGFSDNYIVKTDKKGKTRINTGDLIKGIKAERLRGRQGRGIKFYNDTPEAAFMEYGFHDRGGNYIPARPFMRPALYAVSEGSKGNFKNILKGLIQNLWKEGGYQGVSSLTFGRKSQHKGSSFWNSSQNFSQALSGKSDMKKLTNVMNRRKMSLVNNPPSRKKGFRVKENKQEHYRLKTKVKNRTTKAGRKTSKKKQSKKGKQKTKSNKPQKKPKANIERGAKVMALFSR